MTGAMGGKVTENILPNYTCKIHPVRRIDFIHEFARKNVELRNHNYPFSVEGHLVWWNDTVPQVLIYTATLQYERRKMIRHV